MYAAVVAPQLPHARCSALLDPFGPAVAVDVAWAPPGIVQLARAPRDQTLATATEIAQTFAPHGGVAVGVAAHPFVAGLAARIAGSSGIAVILPGHEATTLAAQPLRLLPIAPSLIARLASFGLRTIGAVAALPAGALSAPCGAAGLALERLVRTLAPPFRRLPPAAPLPAVTRRFDGPVADRAALQAALAAVVTRLARRLAASGLAAQTIDVVCAHETLASTVVPLHLSAPSADRARLLLLAIGALRAAPLVDGVTALTVRVTAAAPVQVAQAELFAAPRAADDRLTATLQALQTRHGAALLRPVLRDPLARCPEQRSAAVPWEDR